jgi:hypothetical protein
MFALAAMLTGCTADNPLDRQPLSGTVTVNKQPLTSGSISFEPAEPGGIASGAVVSEGAFSLDTEHGLPAGRYRVRINAAGDDSAPADLLPGAPAPPAKELIPAKWNRRSEEFVEVTSEGENVFTFAIES